MTPNIKTIVSHESPDLDSILSIYLLRKYGVHKYPGIENAELEFYPAGILPDGKTPEELERDGILVVDTGGGRLDTHPVESYVDLSKADKCASVLVAEDLGLDQRPELEPILTFTRFQDTEGKSLQSADPADHAFSLTNIIRGFNLLHNHFSETVNATSNILDALITAEKECSLVTREKQTPVNLCDHLQIIVTKQDNKVQIRIIRWFDQESENQSNLLDIDTVLSVYLLKNYGAHKYETFFCKPVNIDFVKRAVNFEAVSNQDILLIDNTTAIPQSLNHDDSDSTYEQDKVERKTPCSAIISDVLSLNTVPELIQIVSFIQHLNIKIAARKKSLAIDSKVDIFTILYGFNLLNGSNFQKTIQDMEFILDSVVALGKDWHRAIAQYEASAKVYKTGKKGKVKIVAVEAESGSTLRVARWKDKADLTLYRNPTTKYITITTRRNGPLQNFKLRPIAKLIRIAEAMETKTKSTEKKFDNIGVSNGWFLHPSEKILLKGSPKAAHMTPSQIPFQTIVDLTLSYFDEERKIPDRYCPSTQCLGGKCLFFDLALSNCHVQRERTKLNASSLGARLSPDTLEKLRKLKDSSK